MTEKMIENNKVSVIGEIVSDFTFSHEGLWRRLLYGRIICQPFK